MLICSIAVLFLALQNSSGFRVRVRDVPDTCGKGHQYMVYTVRRTFLQAHNENRASLAEGQVKTERGETLPPAANMRFMAYDCRLEEEATKMTTKCERFSNRTRFTRRGKNFANADYRIDNGPNEVAKQAVSEWWQNKPQWDNLQKIAKDDYTAIPFFLMAQADIDTVGCSVNSCKEDGFESFFTIACVYGKKVEIGGELYKQGLACSNCTKGFECHQNVLCKKT